MDRLEIALRLAVRALLVGATATLALVPLALLGVLKPWSGCRRWHLSHEDLGLAIALTAAWALTLTLASAPELVGRHHASVLGAARDALVASLVAYALPVIVFLNVVFGATTIVHGRARALEVIAELPSDLAVPYTLVWLLPVPLLAGVGSGLHGRGVPALVPSLLGALLVVLSRALMDCLGPHAFDFTERAGLVLVAVLLPRAIPLSNILAARLRSALFPADPD